MSSIFDNSYFYVSIFSSACFLASEILPFLPNNSNGILHAVLLFLSSYNKNKEVNETNKSKENNENESSENNQINLTSEFNNLNIKLDKILNKFDIVKTEKLE